MFFVYRVGECRLVYKLLALKGPELTNVKKSVKSLKNDKRVAIQCLNIVHLFCGG